jgi:hypothetical protein
VAGSTLYVVGIFSSRNITLGTYTLFNALQGGGGYDLFYAKLSTINGSVTYAKRAGSSWNEVMNYSPDVRGALVADPQTGDFFIGTCCHLRMWFSMQTSGSPVELLDSSLMRPRVRICLELHVGHDETPTCQRFLGHSIDQDPHHNRQVSERRVRCFDNTRVLWVIPRVRA